MDDLQRLEHDLKLLEKFPTKYLTKAVKDGGAIILAETKRLAPKRSRTMINAMVVQLERSRKTGKRVVQITFSSKYNSLLVKKSKTGKRSYYPASQEYGWIKRNGERVEGKHFMRDAADTQENAFKKKVIDDMMAKIEAKWRE